MTPDERQAWCESRLHRLQASIDALPAAAQEHLRTYRRCIEMCGRVAPDAVDVLAGYVESLGRMCEAITYVPPAERVAGTVTTGSGF
jgi:hypothetical protein